MIVGRHEDVVTAGITTAVVMVVAALAPAHAWEEPILRLVDTAVGIAVGLAAARLTCKVTARVHALAGARTYESGKGTSQASASACAPDARSQRGRTAFAESAAADPRATHTGRAKRRGCGHAQVSNGCCACAELPAGSVSVKAWPPCPTRALRGQS
jgi:uncharacterized membrane protein YccC